MPYAVGETSAGILRGVKGEPLLLVMGYNLHDQTSTNATMVLDINANKWSVRAKRPCVGNHMAAVTHNNKLYLLGGYLDKSMENMQIYNPITDKWTLGPKLPFKTGAASATVMGNIIYFCGGVDSGNTKRGMPITTCARFNITSNKWLPMAPMIHAVHHASMANDGKQVYVFGGRNSRAGTGRNPVNYTQVYDPATNAWRSNSQVGGPASTPVGRGGMGAAIYTKGHFFILGGEVKCGSSWMGKCPMPALRLSALGVFDRIDRYNPVTNTWDRALPGMSLGRHGSYPVLGPAPNSPPGAPPVVWACAGGIQQSFSENTICTYMTVP